MSTEFKTMDGQPVAVRFWGGKSRGSVVQMEVTETEWPEFAVVACVSETGQEWPTFAEWMDEQWEAGRTVVWDSAARRNEVARDMEAWMEKRAGTEFEAVRGDVEATVAEARSQAKAAAKDSFKVC